jgi:hypothetical protein
MSLVAALTGLSLAFASSPVHTAPPVNPAPAASTGAVLVAGRVTDQTGAPVPGPVSVSVMPRDVKRGDSYPVVAQGTANAFGNYSATVTDPATIAGIARAQSGWIETITASDNANSASAGVRSIQVAGGASALRLSTHAVRDNADVSVAAAAKPLDLTVKSAPKTLIRLDKAPSRACAWTPIWLVTKEETRPAWTVVGELNNAYNDGTVASFTYGQQGHAETSIGIAVAVNAANFSISEESSIDDAASIGFPPFKRRLARKMRTQFTYKRTIETRTCPMTGVSDTRETIRAVRWEGGTSIDSKQPGALDKCVRKTKYSPGGSFQRDTGRAVRWTAGASAFGVSLTTQSGFSKNVSTRYEFGRRPVHFLCGADGKESAITAGRIFSGGKKRA